MQLYEIYYKVPITDNLNQIIGHSDSKTAYIVGTCFNDGQNELLSKVNGAKIEFCRKLADINGFSNKSMDMILTKSCPGYADRKNKKMDQKYEKVKKQNKGSILSKLSKG